MVVGARRSRGACSRSRARPRAAARLAAAWLRVGYVQSNFNADNRLVGGATVDLGPFGFLEAYDPGFAM